MVIIDDIQIRLKTEVNGIVFVTTWWGPKDPMRFAAVNSALNSEKTFSPDEIYAAQQIATQRFIEKIKEFEHGIS